MYQYKYPHPAVTTDIAIFTINDEQLKLLLIKRGGETCNGKWALPGGFVEIDEGLKMGAQRELEEETGILDVFLEQLFTFGEVERDPRERIISVAYFALIPSEKIKLRAASDAEAAKWFSIDELPELAFDHKDIIAMAQQRLTAHLDYSTLAFQFLADEFSLSELQDVYEILQQEMDRRNFRKWVLALEQIEETGRERHGAHRPAKLYRLIHPKKVEIIK